MNEVAKVIRPQPTSGENGSLTSFPIFLSYIIAEKFLVTKLAAATRAITKGVASPETSKKNQNCLIMY